MKDYMKRGAFALGMAAFVAGSAMADGTWQNVNNLIKAPSFVTGWSGNLTNVNEGIGENYNGAFELYQVIKNAPAGNYTLSANAFYRCGNNEYSKENMKDGANHNAFLYLGDAQVAVKGLFDDSETAPNNLAEAKTAFGEGQYKNTVEFNHPGGDLRLGILNKGGRVDEWCAFDNFTLIGPDGEVALVNGDFENQTVAIENGWDFKNNGNEAKLPDTPLWLVQANYDEETKTYSPNQGKVDEYNGKVTGVFRKTNASVYDFGTKVELEKGKYRFGVQSFFRYAPGNSEGKYITVKGGAQEIAAVSGYDMYKASSENPDNFAYLYATNGTNETAEYIKPTSETIALALNPNGFYKKQNIMSLFAEDLEAWPENEPTVIEEGYVDDNGYSWVDSGFEHYSAKFFVNNPDKYRNYVEFEVAEKQTLWLGLAIVNRPTYEDGTRTEYWNPARDFTLEMWVEEEGVSSVADADLNAPVEYYNLQGVRVANPEKGLYIVKQGNKAYKQVIK